MKNETWKEEFDRIFVNHETDPLFGTDEKMVTLLDDDEIDGLLAWIEGWKLKWQAEVKNN